MSDRPYQPRGGARGGRGRGGGRGGGGGGGGHNAQHQQNSGSGFQQQQQQQGGAAGAGAGAGAGAAGNNTQEKERPKKENILDLKKYMDQRITVKFNGGREVTGTLKGYDALMNLVLDEVEEALRDDNGNESTRSLGLVVVRGTLLVVISPVDGSEVIENPFLQAAAQEEE
ncbi:small nuclear ribonucleoprotein [Cladorrhinum sp. PSN332]|nr:small nuclear ribonucleoprotein [Cladorrhinum sp. PSN332]